MSRSKQCCNWANHKFVCRTKLASWRSEDSWNVRYGPEGFGIFSGLGVTVNNIFVNNFFVTGLDESTSYDFYVQSICIVIIVIG